MRNFFYKVNKNSRLYLGEDFVYSLIIILDGIFSLIGSCFGYRCAVYGMYCDYSLRKTLDKRRKLRETTVTLEKAFNLAKEAISKGFSTESKEELTKRIMTFDWDRYLSFKQAIEVLDKHLTKVTKE